MIRHDKTMRLSPNPVQYIAMCIGLPATFVFFSAPFALSVLAFIEEGIEAGVPYLNYCKVAQ
jgi:hypothetical protein